MMDDAHLPWIERYRPTTRKELVGNSAGIDGLLEWLLSWKNGYPNKRAALLIGPPGTGKTSSIGALANDLGYELVEFNASDKRNKDSIEKLVLRSAGQDTLDGSRRVILLDEVDGLSGTGDRGGVAAILKVIESSVHPIVMTANDPNSPRLKELLKRCIVIQFSLLDNEIVVKVLRRLVKENSVIVSQETIERVASISRGDLRAAISDLESIIEGKISEDELEARDTRTSVEQTLKRLFMTTEPAMARLIINQTDVNHDSLVLWFEENIHLHLGTSSELAHGLNSLSIADLYLGRIMRQQNWKLLAYAYDFLSSFIAASRTSTPYRRVTYSEPLWPLLVWKGQRKRGKGDELIRRISNIANISKSRAYDEYIRVIEVLIKANPKVKKDITQWLGIRESIFR